jgi:hypothetical protein
MVAKMAAVQQAFEDHVADIAQPAVRKAVLATAIKQLVDEIQE